MASVLILHPARDETGLIPQAVKANTIPENIGIGGSLGEGIPALGFSSGGITKLRKIKNSKEIFDYLTRVISPL